jgi:myosin I
MKVIGISDEDQNNMLRMLSGILWLGNIKFAQAEGKTVISNEEPLKIASKLLGVESESLERSILYRVINTGTVKRGSTYNVPQSPDQASGNKITK